MNNNLVKDTLKSIDSNYENYKWGRRIWVGLVLGDERINHDESKLPNYVRCFGLSMLYLLQRNKFSLTIGDKLKYLQNLEHNRDRDFKDYCDFLDRVIIDKNNKSVFNPIIYHHWNVPNLSRLIKMKTYSEVKSYLKFKENLFEDMMRYYESTYYDFLIDEDKNKTNIDSIKNSYIFFATIYANNEKRNFSKGKKILELFRKQSEKLSQEIRYIVETGLDGRILYKAEKWCPILVGKYVDNIKRTIPLLDSKVKYIPSTKEHRSYVKIDLHDLNPYDHYTDIIKILNTNRKVEFNCGTGYSSRMLLSRLTIGFITSYCLDRQKTVDIDDMLSIKIINDSIK